MKPGESNTDFSKANWSAFAAANTVDTEEAQRALNDLCAAYWPPLYAYARRSGHTTPDSEALIQGFLQRLLDREAVKTYAPTEGVRPRTWLITCLKRYEVDEWRKHCARRRGQELAFGERFRRSMVRGHPRGTINCLVAGTNGGKATKGQLPDRAVTGGEVARRSNILHISCQQRSASTLYRMNGVRLDGLGEIECPREGRKEPDKDPWAHFAKKPAESMPGWGASRDSIPEQ